MLWNLYTHSNTVVVWDDAQWDETELPYRFIEPHTYKAYISHFMLVMPHSFGTVHISYQYHSYFMLHAVHTIHIIPCNSWHKSYIHLISTFQIITLTSFRILLLLGHSGDIIMFFYFCPICPVCPSPTLLSIVRYNSKSIIQVQRSSQSNPIIIFHTSCQTYKSNPISRSISTNQVHIHTYNSGQSYSSHNLIIRSISTVLIQSYHSSHTVQVNLEVNTHKFNKHRSMAKVHMQRFTYKGPLSWGIRRCSLLIFFLFII